MATQAEIKAALKALCESLTLPVIGYVMIDSRTAEDDPEVASALQSLHPQRICHGVNICLQRMTEQWGDTGCRNPQTLAFKLETMRPYQRRRIEGVTSEQANALAIEELAQALRVSADLGLGGLVRHQLLQSSDDMTIASLDGSGSDASLIHFGRFELLVENEVWFENVA